MTRYVGNYRIGRLLGEGAAGRVHLGTAPDGAQVAVKLLRPSLFARRESEVRWLAEARVGARIEHENVVHVLDAGVDVRGGRSVRFVAMEYVRGETLHDVLRVSARLPESFCADLGSQIALGLAEIHRHDVVHRDLKPDNVLLSADGTTKIADLGLASVHDDVSRAETAAGRFGTLLYAAPEDIAGRGAGADGRSDLYSLGVMLYEMAAGRHPFAGLDAIGLARAHVTAEPVPLGRVAPGISAFFEEFVHALLAKSPDARVGSAADVADALERGPSSRWWRRRPARARTPRPAVGAASGFDATPFVGRERQLRRLRARFRASTARQGGAVLVEGVAGAGKSRLVARFIEHVRRSAPDAVVLRGGHPPGAQYSTCWPWIAALRGGVERRRLEAAVRTGLRDRPEIASAFDALLAGRPAADGRPLMPAAMESGIARTIASLSRRAPVVVVVEDLHFGPPDARRLLAELGAETSGRRVLLIATSRPAADARSADTPGVERIHLPDLDREGTRRMLVAALGDDAAAQSTIESVWLTSRGNAFAIHEVLRDLRERRLLRRTADGAWTACGDARAATAPRRLQSVIRSRLARLGEEDLDLLRAAAVSGASFDPALVAEIARRRPGPTRRRLAYLAARTGLVRPTSDGFEFDHHLVHEAVLSSMRTEVRRRVHAAAADAIGARVRVAAPADANELRVVECEHTVAAGRAECVAALLPAALRHLYMPPQPHRYLELATAALALPGALSGAPRIERLLDLAELRAAIGRPFEDIVACLLEARTLAVSLGNTGLECRVALRLTHFLADTPRVSEARTFARIARRLARRSRDPDMRMQAFIESAFVAQAFARTAQPMRCARAAIAAARRGGDQRLLRGATSFLFEQALRNEDLETAREAERELAPLGAYDDVILRPRCHAHVAGLALAEGRWLDADRAADAGIEFTARRRDTFHEVRCLTRKAVAQTETGRRVVARRCAARAAALAGRLGNGGLQAEVDMALGSMERDEGRHAAAIERFHLAEKTLVTAGELPGAAAAALLQASALVTLGRFESAAAIAARVERARHGALHDVRVSWIRAAIGIARADRDGAIGELRRVAELSSRARLGLWAARADLELAALGVATPEPFESRLRAARDVAGTTGDVALEAMALLLECVHGLRGSADSAREVERLTPRLSCGARLRAEWLLWNCGAGGAHLDEAVRALRRLIRHAPHSDRGVMSERVAIHRDVRAAAIPRRSVRRVVAPRPSPGLAASSASR